MLPHAPYKIALQAIVISTIFGLTGCSTIGEKITGAAPGTSTFKCPYDTIWEQTLLALHPATFTVANKEKGLIETDWEKGMSKSKSGALGRTNLVQERSSIVVELDNKGSTTTLDITHVRQKHHLEGVRSLRWLHAPAVPEIQNRILGRIQSRVKKQGCSMT